MDNRTRLILHALEEAGARNPDLGTFYEFHCALVRVLGQAKEQMAGTLARVDGQASRARQLEGLPLLSFDQLPVQAEQLAECVSAVAQVLSDYDPELAEQTLPGSPTECLTLARQRFEGGQLASKLGEAQDKSTLAQTSVDLALRPYLEWAADQVSSRVDQRRWKRGYCPVCGGPPDLATLDEESGARHLLCSRCDSQWDYRRLGCPFCETADHTKLAYYPSEDGVYRLYVCRECRHYLKTIDLRETTRAVVLPAERITTVAIDMAAQREGYRP